jgi:dTDP-4-dehydrorhamnose reductase
MRVLVFGSSGQLARELRRAAWPKGSLLTFLDRAAADLSKPATLGPLVRENQPDAVIVAAAYTAVDKAESEEALATIINGEAPGAIAAAAAELSAPVVHVSTDYVFDGAKETAYVEDDPVAPINTNFLRTIQRHAATRDTLTVVADQEGCPTAAGDLAAAIVRVLDKPDPPYGAYHLAGATATTWHGFAETIFHELARRGLKRPATELSATSAYPTPARRPMNSRLACGRFADAFGFALPGFEAAVPSILDEVLAQPEGPLVERTTG